MGRSRVVTPQWLTFSSGGLTIRSLCTGASLISCHRSCLISRCPRLAVRGFACGAGSDGCCGLLGRSLCVTLISFWRPGRCIWRVVITCIFRDCLSGVVGVCAIAIVTTISFSDVTIRRPSGRSEVF
jgi:hypothetical protein